MDQRTKAAPLLVYSAESGLGNILHKTIDSELAELQTQAVFTAHLASVLRTMAIEGRGIAWLPRSLISEDLASCKLVPAGDMRWNVELEIRLFRAQSQLGRAAEALWQAAVQSV